MWAAIYLPINKAPVPGFVYPRRRSASLEVFGIIDSNKYSSYFQYGKKIIGKLFGTYRGWHPSIIISEGNTYVWG